MFLYDCSTSRAIFNFSLAFKMFLNKYLRGGKEIFYKKNSFEERRFRATLDGALQDLFNGHKFGSSENELLFQKT